MFEKAKALNGWLKILIVLIPLLVTGLIAYGQLTERVDTLKVASGKMEERVVATEKNQAVNQQMLVEIKDILKEIKEEQKELRREVIKKRDK